MIFIERDAKSNFQSKNYFESKNTYRDVGRNNM